MYQVIFTEDNLSMLIKADSVSIESFGSVPYIVLFDVRKKIVAGFKSSEIKAFFQVTEADFI